MNLINCTSVITLVCFIGYAAATDVHAADAIGVPAANVVARDSDASVTRAAARLVGRWSEGDRGVDAQAGLWPFPVASTGIRRTRCQSKKKGTLIGAAIGGAAGAFALYVNREVSGIVGTANGANRFLAYWTAGGAGTGTLVGLVYCS